MKVKGYELFAKESIICMCATKNKVVTEVNSKYYKSMKGIMRL